MWKVPCRIYTNFIWSQFHRSECSVLVLVLWVGPVSRRAGRVWWDGEWRQVGGCSVTPAVTRWQEPSPGPAPRRTPHLLPPTCRRTLGSICSNLLCVDNSEWWMATLLTKLTLFGLLSSPFVKIEQEIHWNVTGLVRMRKFWVNSPSQFFLYFSLWDLCRRKFISVKKPIQYRTDRCKDLNAENTVCPINQKWWTWTMSNSIPVFMYFCIVLLYCYKL